MLRTWQIRLSNQIEGSRSVPLYLQIIQAIIRDIETGRLAAGTYLPSSRELAATLGVNRKTVVLAYEDLAAQGWLTTTTTRGTCVSDAMPDIPASGSVEDAPARFGELAGYQIAQPPSRPLALARGGGIMLDEGSPDARLFPPETLARAFRCAIPMAAGETSLLYADPRGSPALRTAIAEMLCAQRGLDVDMDNICLTRGSQNGIFLACMALIQPGDDAIVEALTYEPAAAALRAMGANLAVAGVDEGGIDVEAVEAICRKRRVKAVFVTPHHHFPTTVAMRPERRLRLIELARQYGFALIEDDYDHEFHFHSQPLMPIAAFAPDHVMYVGSLSKLLLPALRIGYIAAPRAVIAALAHMVSLSDGMGNAITESACTHLIQSGELRRHARKARQVYAHRREAFAALLGQLPQQGVQFRKPDGGLAFWLRFNDGIEQVEARARALGLRFAGSASYMQRSDAPRGLRIGFASLAPDEAAAAVGILAKAMEG